MKFSKYVKEAKEQYPGEASDMVNDIVMHIEEAGLALEDALIKVNWLKKLDKQEADKWKKPLEKISKDLSKLVS